jgi:hypothetical protein
MQMQYSFLEYSSKHWLSHTASFAQQNTRFWGLWKQLVLTEHALAAKPWTIDDKGVARGLIAEYILNENHPAVLACFNVR